MSVSKPVVLITGCSAGGIGFALCKAIAPSSKVVYATARRIEAMTGLTEDNVKMLVMDVCSAESIGKAVQAVMDEEGRVDIVISNAGIEGLGPLLDIPMAQAEETFNVNYFGTHRLAQAVIPHMAKRRSGKFIIIGSIAGTMPSAWNGTYNASKAALHSFSDVLRQECALFDVQVQLVIGGTVKSNLVKNTEGRFALPQDSLYAQWTEAIYKKCYISTGPEAMPTDQFAARVVKEILRDRVKDWFWLGGFAALFRFLGYLPRSWALKVLWSYST